MEYGGALKLELELVLQHLSSVDQTKLSSFVLVWYNLNGLNQGIIVPKARAVLLVGLSMAICTYGL